MKEHKITQAQLATCIGSTESAISRFVSGKTDKISTEHLLRIASRYRLRGIYTQEKSMQILSTAHWKARALQKSPT